MFIRGGHRDLAACALIASVLMALMSCDSGAKSERVPSSSGAGADPDGQTNPPPTSQPTPNTAPLHVALLVAPAQPPDPEPPLDAEVRYRSADGRTVIISLDSSRLEHLGPRWRVSADLGTAANFRKVFNAQRLVRGSRDGSEAVLNAYLTIDPETAPPSKEALVAALRRVGVDPQTVSGKIVTARMPARDIGAAAALDWVVAIELASRVKVR